MGKLRILLADDNERILTFVRTVLDERFEIIGTVTNGRDAIAEVRRLDPDVLLIDISLPILNGLEVVSHIRPNRRTRFIFLTVHEEPVFVNAAFALGASAYVAKADIKTDLIPAILEVMEGRTYISRSITMEGDQTFTE